MFEYFIASLYAVIVIGLICLCLGIVSIIRSNKNKNPKSREIKKKNGISLIILGGVIVTIFIPAAIHFNETNYSSVWFLELLLFPSCVFVLIISLVVFITIGSAFLKQGFSQKKEGICDTESIVYGFVILGLGILMVLCLVATFIFSVNSLSNSIRENMNKRTSSEPPSSSIAIMRNYLFSVIYK